MHSLSLNDDNRGEHGKVESMVRCVCVCVWVCVFQILIFQNDYLVGINCSNSSKPGHLFFTAYVNVSMWFSS